MNWNLILRLSLFGLAMGIATVFWIPTHVEPFFWLAIFVLCAILIARRCSKRYFLHGFLVSLCNSVWITAVHAAFFDRYVAFHPEVLQMSASLPLSEHPRVAMVLFGPVVGAVFGLVLGLLSVICRVVAFIASKLVKKAKGVL